MLLLVVLSQFHLYISFASSSTIGHKTNADQDNAPHQAASRTSMITSSVTSRLIDGLSGRALDLGNLLPRDDKMDDLFSSQDATGAVDERKDMPNNRDDENGKAGRHKSAISRLPLGDFTKTVDLDHLDNTLDEPEMLINNHQVTPDTFSLSATSNSRHYNSLQLESNPNGLLSGGRYNHQQSHNSRHYGKYSPNMFANNYNLNYIHSFLTSKPSVTSTSLSLQTMQSLLNSNPNGLTMSTYGTGLPASSGGAHAAGSSTSSMAAYQPNGLNNVRGQPAVHQNSPMDNITGQQNSTTTLAADHHPSVTHCGRQQVAYREPRIVGGNNTYEGEFPWAVSIQRHGNHHCGGVIVGHRWILTAAHCVRSQLVGNLIVRTGGHTLTRSINSISGHLEKDFPVEQIIIHDDFSRYDNLTSSQMKSSANTNNADIALLKLKQEISWNEHAWPVCFPSREAGNFSGHDAIVIGWGKLNEKSEEFSNELQKVKLTIIDNKVCQNWFRQAGRDMPIDDRIICAGFKNGGKDACHGDSGGPLLSRTNGQYVVVGVVSTGIGCARPLLPGLYSRVSSYIGWLERHIAN